MKCTATGTIMPIATKSKMHPNVSKLPRKIYAEPPKTASSTNSTRTGSVARSVIPCLTRTAPPVISGKDKQGLKYFKTEASTMDFKIGLNPLQSERRPEKFVTLRHVPVDQDSFQFYVANGLTNFDKLPTWKLATPHNIQRKTPQNASCNACHGKATLFLLGKRRHPQISQCQPDRDRCCGSGSRKGIPIELMLRQVMCCW
jgi:hypothetical protein